VANALTTVTVDLIDEVTVITGAIFAMMIGIDVIIATTTAAMTDATTTVAMTATTGVTTTGVIIVMIAMVTSATTDKMINVMTDVARTTTITTITTGRSRHHRHRPKGATPMACFRRTTARSTSSLAIAKRSKETDKPDQTPRRSGTSTLKTRDLCIGLNSESLSPGKIIGFTSVTPGLTPSRQPHSQWSFTA
jgi:hypothetical protein